jgi:hypothetical protein
MNSILFFLTLTIAVGQTPTHQAGPQHQQTNMGMMQSCPMKVSGAVVSVADVEKGIALTITTKSGDVADLRRRTENMAKMHSSSNTNMHAPMMSFSVKYEEVPDGARVILTPNDPTQLQEFRAKVRQHVEQMKNGDCSMMQGMMMHGMMGGMMGGPKNADPGAKPEPKAPPEDADHSIHHPPGKN